MRRLAALLVGLALVAPSVALAQTEGETDNEVQLTRHSARLIWRRQLTWDWLFLELRGGVSWPRRKVIEERKASPEVGIALEMQFGNRPR